MSPISYMYGGLAYVHDKVLGTRALYHPSIDISYEIAALILPVCKLLAPIVSESACDVVWPLWSYILISVSIIGLAQILHRYFLKQENNFIEEFNEHEETVKILISIVATIATIGPFVLWLWGGKC